MTKLLQINVTANWGSHGKIAEGIGHLALQQGWESYIAYGRYMNPSESSLYRIGSRFDGLMHLVGTRLFDNHGLMSARPTQRLNQWIEELQPDLIHLHNIHGYYLHYPLLFRQLSQLQIPVVWTLHDCWSFTGHCAHYMYAQCHKWQSHCADCPIKQAYPKSLWLDRAYQNYDKKKTTFLSLPQITLVPVSRWLEQELQHSFFKNNAIHQIHNGIDTQVFRIHYHTSQIRQKYHIPQHHAIILGVASNWYHKGLEHFVDLYQRLPKSMYTIIVVGVSKKDRRQLPSGIIAIERTEDREELMALYSAAAVFFNPTLEDNFPTTNLEAMACGTPVVTFDTGGAAECITPQTGAVVSKGNIDAAQVLIEQMAQKKDYFQPRCREHIVEHFEQKNKFQEYIRLYQTLLSSR